jgi:hypothetical protein
MVRAATAHQQTRASGRMPDARPPGVGAAGNVDAETSRTPGAGRGQIADRAPTRGENESAARRRLILSTASHRYTWIVPVEWPRVGPAPISARLDYLPDPYPQLTVAEQSARASGDVLRPLLPPRC